MTNCHCLNSNLKCTTSKDGVRLVTSKYLACGKAGRVLYAGSDLSYHYFTHFGKNVVPGLYQEPDRYKVDRRELKWDNEFSLSSKKPVRIGNQLKQKMQNKALHLIPDPPF